nr:MerR family DNA-binding transcriptional regulator [Brevundimonas sp.]
MDKSALRDTAPQLPIGELSRRTGVNIETVRYYEKIGLMPRLLASRVDTASMAAVICSGSISCAGPGSSGSR